jgi:hypothetical protein
VPAPQQKILVLTGMHRSGTSLLAKLASRAGIDMGAELLEGSKGNRHGHFEDLEVVRFHEDCLSRRGLGPFRLPEGGVSSFLPEEERQAAAIVERRRGHRGDRSHRGDRGRGAWGFKDPRTSLFLPLWDRLLPEAFFLLVYRHPVEVALSLLRRGIDLEVQLDPGTAIRTWTAYNRQLLAFREAHPEHSLLWPISAVVENLGAAWEILTDRSGLPPSDTGNGRLYEPAELQLGLRAREVDWEAVLPEAMELYARLGACADLRETREPSTVRPVPTREGELQEASEILLATVLARAGTPETETGSVIAERHRIDYSQLKRVVNHQAERLRWLGARLEALEREQMLLAETRALRLVKSYWRATRWGKGVKRQAAWRLRQLAGRVPPPPPEEIVVACVAENNPLFLTQALRLALSLRWFGGALARARMQVCVVDGIAAEDRRRLTEAGAEVVIVERFDRRNSPANKLQLFAPALASGARGVLLLDCDTVVVRDPYPLLVGGALQAKIVDVPSVTHDAFERAFRHYGLTLPRARYRTTMLPKERTIFHCNTGVLFLTTEVAKEIVPVWREWNARILDTLHLLGSCAHHCHQASLSLAFSEHSVPFAETPAAFNFPLHMTHLPIVPQLLKIDPAILHYHGEVDPEGLLRPTRYPLAQARIEAFNRRFQAKAQE